MAVNQNGAADEQALTKLKIEGKEYDIPSPEDFTLGEATIIHDYTGKNLDELAELSGTDPSFLSALVLIVLQREDPAVTAADVAGIKLTELDAVEAEEDAGPPVEAVASPETEVTHEVSGAPA